MPGWTLRLACSNLNNIPHRLCAGIQISTQAQIPNAIFNIESGQKISSQQRQDYCHEQICRLSSQGEKPDLIQDSLKTGKGGQTILIALLPQSPWNAQPLDIFLIHYGNGKCLHNNGFRMQFTSIICKKNSTAMMA